MDPNAGRFTTRDSIGIWGDPSNLGNGYTYVGNNPQTFVDPYGEFVPLLAIGAAFFGGAASTVGIDQGMQAAANLWEGRPLTENISGADTLYNAGIGGTAGVVLGPLGKPIVNAAKPVLNPIVKPISSGVGRFIAPMRNNAIVTQGGKIYSYYDDLFQQTSARVGDRVKSCFGGGSTPELKYNNHHSFPKFLGGDPKQKLTNMLESEHIQLHRELNNFLKNKTDDFGNHMRPQRGNSGLRIRENFSEQERIDALSDFYSGDGAKFKDVATDFFEQIKNGQ